jgi:hypothetical protein
LASLPNLDVPPPDAAEKQKGHLLMQTCPVCHAQGQRAIYYGFPLWICVGEHMPVVWGFWAWPTALLPFNGWMMVYEGSYWSALLYWLKGR